MSKKSIPRKKGFLSSQNFNSKVFFCNLSDQQIFNDYDGYLYGTVSNCMP